ncbi:c-type cytochrome [Roseimicrobium sp. ORNL1]|uniref:c-type cytochrome n=1 Tax=Roseimicrobium sp. ORNL1 TaxID=2711231 RepID=UPI0013E1D04B|nr:c-type cytochrome [Roseimicrobium sp. ORNL1]QIF04619.1 c-type cytochrome [Roseimicrobium sp. ORNL1]
MTRLTRTFLAATLLAAGAPTALMHAESPSWIWAEATAKPNQKVYFRKTFEVNPRDTVRLYAASDDNMTVYVNGKEVLKGAGWDKIQVKDLSPFTANGKNVIAVEAGNGSNDKAGLLVKVMVETPKGNREVVTDGSWKQSDKADEGWKNADFSDKAWKPAFVVAKLGEGPWKKVNDDTLAQAADLKKPEATAVKDIKLKEGFKVELLYSVPMAEQGSWVATCFDDKGRLIVSDQYGKLYRVTLPALGGKATDTKVEAIPAEIGEAQGLVYAFGSLYAITNSDKYPRGLWRIQDTNGDDQFDKVEQLRAFPNKGGEHGPHAVVVGPDGKSLYCIVGNQTPITELNSSRVPQHWAEDRLLDPLIGRGFMREVMAPGGWVAKTDPEGKTWELICTGFRNEYDAAFNKDGDLFTFDADMEWDFSVPWYRPTRVCHVLSGGEFGWRSLSKKWPVRWEDSLPPTVDIGPGSPTGVAFGYGAKAFPQKYQDAFYICDWSYGKMYAVHLKKSGAGYTADFEEFMAAQPLPLTDVLISPKDGAMYVTIGGRRVQSGLYRVTYSGDTAAKAPAMTKTGTGTLSLKELQAATVETKTVGFDGAAGTADSTEALHKLRRELEAYHKVDAKAVDFAWPHLGHEDRFIRFAARIAVEHQPVESWKDRALNETNPRASLTALMALARSGKGDKALLPQILASLDKIDFATLKGLDRETYVRDYYLALSRFGEPEGALKEKTAAKLSKLFPTSDPWLNVDLTEVLTYLGDAAFLPKAVALVDTAPTQEEQIAHAMSLRFAKNGWTPELRERFFKWVCLRAPTYKGGASFSLFMQDIRKDAELGLTDAEKVALKPILEAKPDIKMPQFTFTPRSFVKNYTMADLDHLLGVGLEGGRKFENGRNLFGQATCFACHRFGQEGGAIGPDLTSVAGKYSVRDLLVHIVEPSKEISDQYGQLEVTLNDGSKVFGRIMNLAGDRITLNINMMDPNATQAVDRKLVKSMEQSKVSMMPPGLLNTLSESDILDLMAYLLSKGNKEDPMFK